MNAPSLNSSSHATLSALGLGLFGILACSAEASAPPTPSGSANNSNTAAGSGGTATGTGGTGNNVPVAGTSVGPSPGGGTTATGTAGTTATGTAGTTATGTAGTTGSGGGGALTACPSPPAAGTMTDLLIDDLEDGDNGLSKIGGRSGFWYAYADAFGTTISPMPDPPGGPLVPGATMCHGGMKCVIMTGTTVANDETATPPQYAYAGVGFDFSNAMKSCVYNGTAYTGIKFWARGDVPITIKLNTTGTVTADEGGTCTTNCAGFSPAGVDVLLADATMWQQVDIPFATALQPSWATVATLDKAALIGLQIQIPPGQAFNVALDDFTFY